MVVDPATWDLRPDGPEVVAAARRRAGTGIEHELQQPQVELGTAVCEDLGALRRELVRLRGALADAAAARGGALVAIGTHPWSTPHDEDLGITPKPAYLRLEEVYQELARDTLIGGCHVHVGVEHPDDAIVVMNLARAWMPVVVALSASSAFWAGRDTGYASYRTELFRRWPSAGVPLEFADRADFDELIETLLAVQAIDSPARIYWDIRPSARYQTVEVRAADVCASVDEAVMVAGLARGLAMAALAGDLAPPRVRPEVLRAAVWQAARHGLGGTLIDLERRRAVPAAELVERLLDQLGSALATAGDRERVTATVERVLAGGNAADRQRSVHERTGRLEDVVAAMAAETVAHLG